MSENSQNQDKFILRLPNGMRDQIKIEAAKNHRSMNQEIVARLAFSLSQSMRETPIEGLERRAFEMGRNLDKAMVLAAIDNLRNSVERLQETGDNRDTTDK